MSVILFTEGCPYRAIAPSPQYRGPPPPSTGRASQTCLHLFNLDLTVQGDPSPRHIQKCSLCDPSCRQVRTVGLPLTCLFATGVFWFWKIGGKETGRETQEKYVKTKTIGSRNNNSILSNTVQFHWKIW